MSNRGESKIVEVGYSLKISIFIIFNQPSIPIVTFSKSIDVCT